MNDHSRTLYLVAPEPMLWWIEQILLTRRAILAGEPVERRLAAVLAADVAAYSRLMGRDEERTLANLKSFRNTASIPQSPRIAAASLRLPATAC